MSCRTVSRSAPARKGKQPQKTAMRRRVYQEQKGGMKKKERIRWTCERRKEERQRPRRNREVQILVRVAVYTARAVTSAGNNDEL